MNSTKICRLCLETSVGLVNILEKFEDSTIASILAEHFWFQDATTDEKPEFVCALCWSQTKTFHLFFKRIELCHQSSWSSITVIGADGIKQERSVSPVEEALEVDLNVVKCKEETDDVTLAADDMHTIAKEEDICDDDNNENSCDENESRPTSDSEDDESQLSNDNLKNKDARGYRKNKMRDHSPSEKDEKEKEDAEIYRFFSMKCHICGDVEFETLKQTRTHFRKVHRKRGYLICCGNKFNSRYLMLEHIQYHVNPDAHRCEYCNKRFKDKRGLAKHIKFHVVVDRKSHKCSSCPKTFLSAATLRYHVRDKHSTDTSEKFHCDQCGKNFTTKFSLANHINNIHEQTLLGNVCETCGRSFKSKVDLKYHIEMIHSTTPPRKVQCDICGTWLKHKRYLPQHLRWHQETQNSQDDNAKAFSCPICKKKSPTKRALSSHIQHSHGDRKHQCTICDKAFRRAKVLREHMALHTGVDLYSCTYCDRTFKSNANMYSHRKKAHLAEWTRDRANTTTTTPTESIKLDRVDSKNVEAFND